MATNNRTTVSGWVGWIFFAGFMMFITGLFQMISGFTALLNDTFYVVRDNGLAVFNFTTWGWIHIGLGLLIMLAGMAVLSGHFWGRVVAVLLVIVSAIANFAFLSAYPIWSIIALTVDVLILYALTVHGSEVELVQ